MLLFSGTEKAPAAFDTGVTVATLRPEYAQATSLSSQPELTIVSLFSKTTSPVASAMPWLTVEAKPRLYLCLCSSNSENPCDRVSNMGITAAFVLASSTINTRYGGRVSRRIARRQSSVSFGAL